MQLDLKKEARADRFGLNAEKKRLLERAKRFNLETADVVRAANCCLLLFGLVRPCLSESGGGDGNVSIVDLF